jgi:dipeptidyl aminopeptidase/acylaminoacyl peptidase
VWALRFSTSHSDLFEAAAVSSDSGRDPIFFYLASALWHRNFKHWGLGLPDGETAARWRELSPSLNAERIKAPLLINVADTAYLLGLQYYTTLRELKKPVEMFIYVDELHIKNHPKHRYEIYIRNVDWLNFWLQDKEDPDPAKKEQYNRWSARRLLLYKLDHSSAGWNYQSIRTITSHERHPLSV